MHGYTIPIQPLDKLMARLQEVYKRPNYDTTNTISEVMWYEGQQHVINFIKHWMKSDDSYTSGNTRSKME